MYTSGFWELGLQNVVSWLALAIQKGLVGGHVPLALCVLGWASASISQELHGRFDSLTAVDSRRFTERDSDVQ